MQLRLFLPWSLLGTAVWATTFTLVRIRLPRTRRRGHRHADAWGPRRRGARAAILAWCGHRRSAAQRAQQLAGPLGQPAYPLPHLREP
jgi:hypothetical protein